MNYSCKQQKLQIVEVADLKWAFRHPKHIERILQKELHYIRWLQEKYTHAHKSILPIANNVTVDKNTSFSGCWSALFLETLTLFFLTIISFPCQMISAGPSSAYSQSSSSSNSFSCSTYQSDGKRKLSFANVQQNTKSTK